MLMNYILFGKKSGDAALQTSQYGALNRLQKEENR